MPRPPARPSSVGPLPPPLRAAALLAVAALAACSKPEPTSIATVASAPPAASTSTSAPTSTVAKPPLHPPGGIAWTDASTDAEVDAAFARARREAKPVFVYWGASWCPPCNQVKATLFNRQDFIERSRAFVPVYVDGDRPGAQKVGARFHVSGYPTMVLFTPQGAELTRLPGEVEPERYTQVLTLGMNADRPVREVLAAALAGGAAPAARDRTVEDAREREVAGSRARDAVPQRALGPNDWRLLAFYAWDVDEAQVVPKARLAATLARLADACPPSEAEAATRLRLKALAAAAPRPAGAPGVAPRAKAASTSTKSAAPTADRALLAGVLADPAGSRRVLDLLTNNAAELVRAVAAPDDAERPALLAAYDAALQRFEADPEISRADRIAALVARVDLVRIDLPKTGADGRPPPPPPLSEPLLFDIREQTAAADREITDGYERQAVITACAYLLEHAGLGAESDTLLKANLAKSHSPYYLMSELAANAKARGDADGALRWSGEAYAKSEGPATRLQWGSSYIAALVDLAPKDEARVEQVATQILGEAAKTPDAFDGRSGRSLQRVGTKLAGWNAGGAHAAVLARLQTRLDGVCAGLPPADAARRAACAGLLKPAANGGAKSGATA